MAFIGFFGASVGNVASGVIQTAGDGWSPIDANAFPTYKIYRAGGGAMPNGTGTASFIEEPAISLVSGTTPIIITSANHGLLTGTLIEIEQVGNLALGAVVNGEHVITRIDTNTFSINETFDGSYTASTGKWHRVGIYKWSHTLNPGDGYLAGESYIVVADASIDSGAPPVAVTVTGDDTFQYVG